MEINGENHDSPLHGLPTTRFWNRDDRFHHGLDASVADFWEYAYADLRMNTVRGVVAEFVVAQALGVPGPRVDWEPFDILAGNIRVEVKCGAYLQAWDQSHLSKIVFSGLRARTLDPASNAYTGDKGYNADVYVFALLTSVDHSEFDVLDLRQWEFYVTSRSRLAQRGTVTLTLEAAQRMARGPLHFGELREAVTSAHAENDLADTDSEIFLAPQVVVEDYSVAHGEIVDISPRGIGHLPGCHHKEDPDMSRWGRSTRDGAWTDLCAGKVVVADSGAVVGLTAQRACTSCISTVSGG